MKYLLLVVLFTSIIFSSRAQIPYTLSPGTDIPILGFGTFTMSYALFLHKNHPVLTQVQASAIDTTLLGIFDLPTIHYNNKTADKISTIMLGLSFLSVGAPLLDSRMQDNYGTYLAIQGETILNGLGTYGSFKNTVNRPRPYMCTSSDTTCMRFSKGATSSFPSGHVTMTACNTFYTAKIINDISHNTALKIGAWTTASIYPAIVAYLRVKSGKHYPTDVIAGYLIGAATGILIADLHQLRAPN